MKRIMHTIRAISILAGIGFVVAFLGLPNQWLLYIEAIICVAILIASFRLRKGIQKMHSNTLVKVQEKKEDEDLGEGRSLMSDI